MGSDDNLDRALRGLVAAQTLTQAQADAVRRAVDDAAPRRAVSPTVEAVGYLGAVLAATAAIAIASTFWADMALWAQVGLLGLVAVGLLGAGAVVRGTDDPAASRLSGFCWLLSTASFAGAVGVMLEPQRALWLDDAFTLSVAVPSLIYALVLWRLRAGALQLLAVWGAVIGLTLGLVELPARPPWELTGLAFWAIGAAALALVWGDAIRPRRAAVSLAAVTMAIGAQGWAFEESELGSVLLVLTAAGLMAFGARVVREPVAIGVGAVALAVGVPQVLEALAPGTIGAPALVLVAGIVLLAGALVAVRSSRNRSAGEHQPGPRSGEDPPLAPAADAEPRPEVSDDAR